jgi:hypothetical protein
MSKTWCVMARDKKWCATKSGERPVDTATSVPTRCGFFVILPWGIERRNPTCVDCKSRGAAAKETR